MSRVIWCSLVVLSLLALTGLRPSGTSADDTPVKLVKEWKAKFSNEQDEPLMKEAPKSGYITSEKAWAKLWKAWRDKEKLPKIDFEKQVVFVAVVSGRDNNIKMEFSLSEKGDLDDGFMSTTIDSPGFSYMIAVIDRANIKTYRGKAFEKE